MIRYLYSHAVFSRRSPACESSVASSHFLDLHIDLASICPCSFAHSLNYRNGEKKIDVPRSFASIDLIQMGIISERVIAIDCLIIMLR